jgi:hypothetical protein
VTKRQLQKTIQNNLSTFYITNYGKIFFLCDDVNTSLDAYLSLFVYYFKTVVSLKQFM